MGKRVFSKQIIFAFRLTCIFYEFFQIVNGFESQFLIEYLEMKNFGSMYTCTSVLGFKNTSSPVYEDDLISVAQYSKQGDRLALGDKSGRIIIFQAKMEGNVSYSYEFSAYDKEFDCLNSAEVSEEVKGIKWLNHQDKYQKILTMNSRSIILWKLFRKEIKTASKPIEDLILPKFDKGKTSIQAIPQIVFPTKLEEDLTGMDLTYNEQFMVCADPVKALVWDIEKNHSPFYAIDLQKQKSLQDVKENITCIRAHPTSDCLFAYGTNKGKLAVTDMRANVSESFCSFGKSHVKSSYINALLDSYSSIQFLGNSKYVACRDYLTVKVWDLKKADRPVFTVTIEDSLKSRLGQAFDNECIYDKFPLRVSPDSSTILTGGYNNTFHLIDADSGIKTPMQINAKKQIAGTPSKARKSSTGGKIDFVRKTIALDFNPKGNIFSVASL